MCIRKIEDQYDFFTNEERFVYPEPWVRTLTDFKRKGGEKLLEEIPGRIHSGRDSLEAFKETSV